MGRMQGQWECEPVTIVRESSLLTSEVSSATTATGCSAVGGTKNRNGRKSAWQKGCLAGRRVARIF